MMFPMSVMILFCIYFYLLTIGDMVSIYSSANGLWWKHRYRSLAEAATNFALNFILGKFFGIYGILIATIITIFVSNFVWGIRIIFKYYFQIQRLKEYYSYHLKYALTTFSLCILTYSICSWISCRYLIGLLFLRMTVCVVLPNIGYLLIYRNADILHQVKEMMLTWIKK